MAASDGTFVTVLTEDLMTWKKGDEVHVLDVGEQWADCRVEGTRVWIRLDLLDGVAPKSETSVDEDFHLAALRAMDWLQ